MIELSRQPVWEPIKEPEQVQIGDRVRFTGDHHSIDAPIKVGDEGIFVEHNTGRPPAGVNWDKEHPRKHDCRGHADYNRGYYVFYDDLEVLREL